MACSASDVLLKAKEVKTLKEAVKDSHFIVGTTRRKGSARFPVFTMDEALPKILSVSKKNTVSILFGREDSGLENEETIFCDILFEIPAHKGHDVLKPFSRRLCRVPRSFQGRDARRGADP